MEANQMRARFNLLKEASRLANRTFNDREIEDFLNKAQEEFVKERYAAWKNRPQIGYGQHPVRNAELAGLLTATQSVPRTMFIVGTELNGALQGPDLDKGGVTQDADRFGVFVGLPDEVLYPIVETCQTSKGDVVKRNTPVNEVNLQGYINGIYDDYAKPYDNLVWSLDWGAYTTAEPNVNGTYDESVKEYSTSGTDYNMSGENYLGATITINTNRAKYLLPGKGWKVDKYTVFYIKLPKGIRVDVQTPSLQQHCELPPFTHDEVVSKAVKIASAAVIPDPNQYQINDKESKEDE
ncbi:MAG: hypothetical protein M0R17_04575 [Candidatus Omnitrophica bacterium]|jgi:hypothetical protein|nr:hypothetical protein [Candidatus Omnitrophota bacterium]